MSALLFLLIGNAAYVAALPSATIFYVANVLLHLVLGAAAVVWLFRIHRRSAKFIPLALAALLGVYLIFKGAVTTNRWAVAADGMPEAVVEAAARHGRRHRSGGRRLRADRAGRRRGGPVRPGGDRRAFSSDDRAAVRGG